MNELTATFSVKDGKEYVTISGAYLGKDAVVREVTAVERRQFSDQYEAWKKGEEPPPPTTTTLPSIRADGKVG